MGTNESNDRVPPSSPHDVEGNNNENEIKIQIEKEEENDSVAPPPPLTASSSCSSASESPVLGPPQLARAQARIVALRPGAVHMPGALFQHQQQQQQQPDEENGLVTSRNDDNANLHASAQNSAMATPELVVHAELAVQPPPTMEATVTATNTDTSPAVPPPAVEEDEDDEESPSPKPSLVHAEPLREPKIGWTEIWNNRPIRISIIMFVLLLVFSMGMVSGLFIGMHTHDHGNNMEKLPLGGGGGGGGGGPRNKKIPFYNGTFYFNGTMYNVTGLNVSLPPVDGRSEFQMETKGSFDEAEGDEHLR